jgi:hypothetical protein
MPRIRISNADARGNYFTAAHARAFEQENRLPPGSVEQKYQQKLGHLVPEVLTELIREYSWGVSTQQALASAAERTADMRWEESRRVLDGEYDDFDVDVAAPRRKSSTPSFSQASRFSGRRSDDLMMDGIETTPPLQRRNARREWTPSAGAQGVAGVSGVHRSHARREVHPHAGAFGAGDLSRRQRVTKATTTRGPRYVPLPESPPRKRTSLSAPGEAGAWLKNGDLGAVLDRSVRRSSRGNTRAAQKSVTWVD